jgi:hypothetical protein
MYREEMLPCSRSSCKDFFAVFAGSKKVDCVFDEEFCFGSWDETVGGDFDGQRIELGFADEIGDGFRIDSAFYELVQMVKLGLGGGFVEVRIDLDSLKTHYVADEKLGRQTGRVHAFFGEVVGCPVKQFFDCPVFHIPPA